eukprot:scaffold8157_cov116-Skeletonema_dohrnii-CCMP3373.AAC.4
MKLFESRSILFASGYVAVSFPQTNFPQIIELPANSFGGQTIFDWPSNQQMNMQSLCIEPTALQFKELSEPCCFPDNIKRRIIHSAREVR